MVRHRRRLIKEKLPLPKGSSSLKWWEADGDGDERSGAPAAANAPGKLPATAKALFTSAPSTANEERPAPRGRPSAAMSGKWRPQAAAATDATTPLGSSSGSSGAPRRLSRSTPSSPERASPDGPSLVDAASADLSHGRALLAAGTPLQAEAVVRGALTRLEGSVGAHHPETLRAARVLIECLLKQRSLAKLMEAELLLWRVFEQAVAASSTPERRHELHTAHTQKLRTLLAAQSISAARNIQRAWRATAAARAARPAAERRRAVRAATFSGASGGGSAGAHRRRRLRAGGSGRRGVCEDLAARFGNAPRLPASAADEPAAEEDLPPATEAPPRAARAAEEEEALTTMTMEGLWRVRPGRDAAGAARASLVAAAEGGGGG